MAYVPSVREDESPATGSGDHRPRIAGLLPEMRKRKHREYQRAPEPVPRNRPAPEPMTTRMWDVVAGTVWTSGLITCARTSSCGSLGAKNAPAAASGPGPPWRTTSRRTAVTGCGSLIGVICSHSASIAMIEKQRWNRRKSAENGRSFELFSGQEATSALLRVRRCVSIRTPACAQGKARGFPTHPRPEKDFGRGCARPHGPSNVRKFPPSGFRPKAGNSGR